MSSEGVQSKAVSLNRETPVEANLGRYPQRDLLPQCLIDKLPMEFIKLILYYVTGLDHPWNWNRDNVKNVALVKKSWHALSDTADFWPRLAASDPDRVLRKTILKNPKGPLAIVSEDADFDEEEESSPFFSLASKHRSRWQTFWWQGYESWEMVRKQLDKPTPALRDLYLAWGEGDFETATLKLGSGGSLRNLDISNVALPWRSKRLQGVQSLRLALSTEEAMPPLSDLMKILSTSPSLERLELNFYGGTPEGKVKDVKAIQLPRLRSLILADVGTQFETYLLSRISAKTCRSFYGSTTDIKSISDMTRPLFQTIVPLVRGAATLELEYGRGTVPWVILRTPGGPKGFSDDAKIVNGLSLKLIAIESVEEEADTLWRPLCIFLKSTSIAGKSLTLTVECPTNQEEFLSPDLKFLLRSLPSLVALTIVGGQERIDVLNYTTIPQEGSFLFSNLKLLDLGTLEPETETDSWAFRRAMTKFAELWQLSTKSTFGPEVVGEPLIIRGPKNVVKYMDTQGVVLEESSVTI